MKALRKGIIGLSLLAAMLILAGCGKLSDYVQNEVNSASESMIESQEGYQKYKRYLDDNVLDDNDLFPAPSSEDPDDIEIDPAAVRVTIAENSFLNCNYYTAPYTDPGKKTSIASNELYLAPGDSLYVSTIDENNSISNLYDFNLFRIWSFDEKGNRGSTPYQEVKIKNDQAVKNEDRLILTIPEDYHGEGFSIEPIGSYTDRHITARAYYLSNGKEVELPSGVWEVNSKPFTGSVDISPVDSYTIVYNYDAYSDDYYFIRSTPTCWYAKTSDNSVIFREVSSNEKNAEFAVEMHQYVTLNVKNSCRSWSADIPFIGNHGEGIIKSITRGSEPLGQESIGEASFAIRQLKVNDTISIRVGSGYKVSGTNVNVGTAIPLGSNAENGYEYAFVVPDTDKGIDIEITERNSNADATFQGYNMPNADVSLIRANGTVLKSGDELPGDNEKVTLTITPRAGYYIDGFTDQNTYSFVKKDYKFSKLESEILSLMKEHSAIRFISLNLVFADETGSFVYKLDGKEITASSLPNVRVGQTLSFEYKAANGYKITHSWIGSTIFHNVLTWAGGTDSISDSIKISADMDGTTIDRDTLGIVVERTR